MTRLFLSMIVLATFMYCSPGHKEIIVKDKKPVILKAQFFLNAFSVESDSFPSIKADIDFSQDTTYCEKTYYNPAIKGNIYRLTHDEIKRVLSLLEKPELQKLKNMYDVQATDQPTSTATIFTNKGEIIVLDRGLQGEYPLKEIYKIVYKF